VAQGQTAESSGAGNSAQTKQEEPISLKQIVVSSGITYRKHIDVPAPKLVFSKKFFNKFEPVTVGDQPRPVPDVSFVGDIGESSQPQMRPLGHVYPHVVAKTWRL